MTHWSQTKRVFWMERFLRHSTRWPRAVWNGSKKWADYLSAQILKPVKKLWSPMLLSSQQGPWSSLWILLSARSWHYGRRTGLSDVMRFANLLLSWVSYSRDYLNSLLAYLKMWIFYLTCVISNSAGHIACLFSAKLSNFLLSEIFSSPKYRLWFHRFSEFFLRN